MNANLVPPNTFTRPSYRILQWKKCCSHCYKMIPAGDSAFYFGATKKAYHFQCGLPSWKAPGSPYAERRSVAIGSDLSRKAEPVQSQPEASTCVMAQGVTEPPTIPVSTSPVEATTLIFYTLEELEKVQRLTSAQAEHCFAILGKLIIHGEIEQARDYAIRLGTLVKASLV